MPKERRCKRDDHDHAPNGQCVTCKHIGVWARRLGVAREEIEGHWPPPDFCESCEYDIGIPQFDHCHKTKKFRGWLCKFCNMGLGSFFDDPKRLHDAAKYLRRVRN